MVSESTIRQCTTIELSILETFSTRPIWWHYLCITVPYVIKRPNAAFMLIDGGTNRDG